MQMIAENDRINLFNWITGLERVKVVMSSIRSNHMNKYKTIAIAFGLCLPTPFL